ncbi:MAG: hypothetical protein JXB38_20090 [Anaerolineales bacterium]|nr:hypothetical protein [Anaerolineales bacterium]
MRKAGKFYMLAGLALLFSILMVSCGGAAPEELVVTYVAQTEAAYTATNTLLPTATITQTPVPTITQTPAPTNTPTEVVAMAAIQIEEVELRSGPSPDYGLVAVVSKGEALQVIGQLEQCSWLLVELPDGEQAWLLGLFAEVQPACDLIAVAEAPAEPTAVAVAEGTPSPEDLKVKGSHQVYVNNKTGDNVTIVMKGPAEYTFNIPPGNWQSIWVLPGRYRFELTACGEFETFSHQINSKWYFDLKCDE